MKSPVATTVATVEPLMAPNMARPSGSQPTVALAKRISLVTMESAVMMLPQRIKNKTMINAKLSMEQNRVCTRKMSGMSVNRAKPARAVNNRHKNTGTVRAMALRSSGGSRCSWN